MESDGFYGVRIWKDAQWHLVVVDDRLPVCDDRFYCEETRQIWAGKFGGGAPDARRLAVLKGAHSPNRSVFWVALLEKAYAKFCGSYAALSSSAYTASDFCGMLAGPDVLASIHSGKQLDVSAGGVDSPWAALRRMSVDAVPAVAFSKQKAGMPAGRADVSPAAYYAITCCLDEQQLVRVQSLDADTTADSASSGRARGAGAATSFSMTPRLVDAVAAVLLGGVTSVLDKLDAAARAQLVTPSGSLWLQWKEVASLFE